MHAVGSPSPTDDAYHRLREDFRRSQEVLRSLTELLEFEAGARTLEELLDAVTRRLKELRWVAPNLGASVILAEGGRSPAPEDEAFRCPHHAPGERPPCFGGEVQTDELVHDLARVRCPAGRSRLRVPIPGDRGDAGTIHLCLAEGTFRPEAVRFLQSLALLLSSMVRRRRAEERMLEAQKREALGRLAGGIAHDFKNLLAVILSTGELARDELPEGSQAREDLSDILAAARRGLDLTQQLVALGRPAASGDDTVEPAPVLRDLERLLRRTLGSRIRLELEIDPAADRVAMGRSHLEQVLLNLAVNARDAMPDGGTLRFELAGEAREDGARLVRIAAADTGAGIPARLLGRIFDPDFSTKEDRGTGLGLATVQAIVRRAGGTIAVASTPGRGTRFDIVLPAAGARGERLPAG